MRSALAGLVLTSLLCSPGTAQQRDTLREAVVRANRAMMDAFNRGDALGVANLYTDDARIVGPSGIVAGREAVNRYWTSFGTAGRKWTLDVLETGGDRNTAFQVGRSSIATPNGDMITEFIGVWKRQPNGELKLALDAWTSRGRAPASTTLADSIRALDAGWARSYAVHDTAYAKSLFADDFVMVSGNGSVKTKEGELRDVRPQANLKMDYFRTRDVDVRIYGNTASASGIAEWSFTSNGRPSTTRRQYTAMYVRGGPLGWRMVTLHIRPVT